LALHLLHIAAFIGPEWSVHHLGGGL